MSPEQAAFCVLYPDHPAAKELIARDWDMQMEDPRNRAIMDRAVRGFSDAIDDHVARSVYRDLFGEA